MWVDGSTPHGDHALHGSKNSSPTNYGSDGFGYHPGSRPRVRATSVSMPSRCSTEIIRQTRNDTVEMIMPLKSGANPAAYIIFDNACRYRMMLRAKFLLTPCRWRPGAPWGHSAANASATRVWFIADTFPREGEHNQGSKQGLAHRIACRREH